MAACLPGATRTLAAGALCVACGRRLARASSSVVEGQVVADRALQAPTAARAGRARAPRRGSARVLVLLECRRLASRGGEGGRRADRGIARVVMIADKRLGLASADVGTSSSRPRAAPLACQAGFAEAGDAVGDFAGSDLGEELPPARPSASRRVAAASSDAPATRARPVAGEPLKRRGGEACRWIRRRRPAPVRITVQPSRRWNRLRRGRACPCDAFAAAVLGGLRWPRVSGQAVPRRDLVRSEDQRGGRRLARRPAPSSRRRRSAHGRRADQGSETPSEPSSNVRPWALP